MRAQLSIEMILLQGWKWQHHGWKLLEVFELAVHHLLLTWVGLFLKAVQEYLRAAAIACLEESLCQSGSHLQVVI